MDGKKKHIKDNLNVKFSVVLIFFKYKIGKYILYYSSPKYCGSMLSSLRLCSRTGKNIYKLMVSPRLQKQAMDETSCVILLRN